ncbi:MAG: zinc ribbon domain-containing protein [Rhizobiaceae bacterium]|nr:zinc ribbon domain-containing protein [Rhizobiaceae bacterium]
MPLYAYDCDRCGSFEEFRSVALFAEPCACPACGHLSPRQLASAQLGFGAQPKAVARSGKAHRVGCGCCTPPARKGLKAEAVALGAPKRAKAPASTSFLDRP